jgi:D-3-phosphoglycerate dehydrogenase
MLEPGRPLHEAHTLQVTPRVAGTTLQSRRRSAWSVARRIDDLLASPVARPVFKATLPSGGGVDVADDLIGD